MAAAGTVEGLVLQKRRRYSVPLALVAVFRRQRREC
jgi:hypothetical protein